MCNTKKVFTNKRLQILLNTRQALIEDIHDIIPKELEKKV